MRVLSWHNRLEIALAVACLMACTKTDAPKATVTAGGKVPEYFGLFALADTGDLIEIGKPTELLLEGLAPPYHAFFGACDKGLKIRAITEFVLYDDNFRPDDVKLVRVKPFWRNQQLGLDEEAVDLRVAPVESKKSMYRLIPKASVSAGLYVVGGGLAERKKTYGALLTVGSSLESIKQGIATARTAELTAVHEREERLRLATTPSRTLTTSEWHYILTTNPGTLVVTDVGVQVTSPRGGKAMNYSELGDCEVNEDWHRVRLSGTQQITLTWPIPGTLPVWIAQAHETCRIVLEARMQWRSKYPEFAR